MSEFNNPFSLKGKTILVTGASSGIGKATACLAAQLGAKVILVARDLIKLNDVADSLSNCDQVPEVISADLTVSGAIDNLIGKIVPVDGIVLCAGKGLTLPVQFCDRKNFDEIFELNFFSTVELIRLIYKKKKINKGGSIVALSSMGGTHIFSGGNGIYGASKAALDSFMKFAAKEFAARKIRVNTILPAMVDTPLIHRGTISDEQLAENAKIYPLKRYGQPEDIANAAIYLLSEASAWVTGTSLIIDGGLSIS